MSNNPTASTSTDSDTRRNFLRRAPLLATGALAACAQTEQQAAPAIQTQQHFKWKMVTTWPKNFPGLGTGANNLARYIETMSGGRLAVKVYGAGELVPASGVFDAVSGGTAEIGHGVAYYWKGKHEATQFFSAVPFGLNANEINGWLRYGGGQELWDELYGQFGLKAFPVGNTGVQMGGWFNKEINEVGDFSGREDGHVILPFNDFCCRLCPVHRLRWPMRGRRVRTRFFYFRAINKIVKLDNYSDVFRRDRISQL